MGCDIHMVVELFDWTGSGDSEKQRWSVVLNEAAAYGERNYALFGLLAGVRAVDMPLLAAPRGVPEDVSTATKRWAKRMGVDGHTHSWVTLKEVLDFDWSRPTCYDDVPTCEEACSDFLAWARGLTKGPTRLARRAPENIRLVFWFDN